MRMTPSLPPAALAAAAQRLREGAMECDKLTREAFSVLQGDPLLCAFAQVVAATQLQAADLVAAAILDEAASLTLAVKMLQPDEDEEDEQP